MTATVAAVISPIDAFAAAGQASDREPEIAFLTDGGQGVEFVADRLVAFLSAARTSLEIAIYDAHFNDEHGDVAARILRAIADAEHRGVQVRTIFNDVDGPGPYPTAERHAGPNFLRSLGTSVESRGVDGRYDLMHHKYVIRDAHKNSNAAVWTGSTNWTSDSFVRMENAIVVIPGTDVAAAYLLDFEQLWSTLDVENSGRFDDEPATMSYRGAPMRTRAFFSPGRGRAMSQIIATRIGNARHRVRVCSPVLTSTPILGTVAEVLADGNVDTLVTVDATQMRQVLQQWGADGRATWKAPLFERVQSSGRYASKHSTPYAPGSTHDFMHAKLIVADDWVLTGSFNCSHSGEMNAENLLEIRNQAFADRCAEFAERVYDRYR